MRAHAFRLMPGTDLKAELQRLTDVQGFRAACVVSCVGSLSRARLRLPSAIGEVEAYVELAEPLEIVSLAGTLSSDGLHIHISLARRDGACIGGHLVPGCIVHTTAEVVIGELPEVEFSRPLDPVTAYNELRVEAGRGQEGSR